MLQLPRDVALQSVRHRAEESPSGFTTAPASPAKPHNPPLFAASFTSTLHKDLTTKLVLKQSQSVPFRPPPPPPLNLPILRALTSHTTNTGRSRDPSEPTKH